MENIEQSPSVISFQHVVFFIFMFSPPASEELDIIKKGIDSFSSSTCIRFLPRTTEKDFLYIQSLNGYMKD